MAVREVPEGEPVVYVLYVKNVYEEVYMNVYMNVGTKPSLSVLYTVCSDMLYYT